MTRSLATIPAEAIANQSGYETADLVELFFGSGVLRWTTASIDLSWNGFTWTAVGGALIVGDPQESSDDNAAGLSLSFSATDGTVMAALLGQSYLGRIAKVYRATLRQTDASIEALKIFEGYMNDSFQIRDERDPVTGAGSVEVETRLTARTGDLVRQRGFRTNVESHTAVYSGDLFFQFVPELTNKTIRWGRPVVLNPIGSGGAGAGGPLGNRGGKTLE